MQQIMEALARPEVVERLKVEQREANAEDQELRASRQADLVQASRGARGPAVHRHQRTAVNTAVRRAVHQRQ